MVILVTCLVIPERLLRFAEVRIQFRNLRMELQHVVDHGFDFVRQEHPHFADHFDAERVDCANDLVFVFERLQTGADVLPELTGNHAVERHDQHLVAVHGVWPNSWIRGAKASRSLKRPDQSARGEQAHHAYGGQI